MNENISPLSAAEQIEVLEAAKVALVELSDNINSIGLCRAISAAVREKHNRLSILVYKFGVSKVIPSFTFDNAVLHGSTYWPAYQDWYWWSTNISKGGITNRLAFLDFLINKLKNENHE